MSNNVLVIGGLGFIGHHIVNQLKEAGYSVAIGTRSQLSAQAEGDLIYINLATMSGKDLEDILHNYTYVIFCGGADDRTIQSENANTFYYRENVQSCVRLTEAGNKVGVKKIIILGSYFSFFARSRPEWKMYQRHPYVRSRKLQLEECLNVPNLQTHVVTLEIPYVFGAVEGKIPLWKPLIMYIKKMPWVFYTPGGTNIISVEQVSLATLGLLNTTDSRSNWTVGSENVSWKQLIQMISHSLGLRRRVITLPKSLVKLFAIIVRIYFKLSGKKPGLDPYHFIEVQCAYTYLDTTESMCALGYEKTNMQASIDRTVAACLP